MIEPGNNRGHREAFMFQKLEVQESQLVQQPARSKWQPINSDPRVMCLFNKIVSLGAKQMGS